MKIKTSFDKIEVEDCKSNINSKGGHSGMNDIHGLAHSKWNCKYHIAFAPKYRRVARNAWKKGRKIV